MNSKTRTKGTAPRRAAGENPATRAAAAPAPPAGYQQAQSELAIRMGRFFVPHLGDELRSVLAVGARTGPRVPAPKTADSAASSDSSATTD